ncbi:RNA-directed RNA polymerase [ssRNA phage Esthiorhiza.2_12]|uniref:RNA-directed RNA polymerase n=2 Tax=Leviviricetes TaxID=2842243 RepID=A0A8S5L217_9VIRU|nr:RNA-directed RNA polymerase [ssRNA phage Esthiorhiza.2_12]QDH91531.1 MAG: RNA-dependent RNA polymerase [Leviviridae sp.]DAD51413.1 TPA_asm: RNA-directed RNA polymerase [ssRNA phage Esthiorhiza.2_12]
MKSRQVSVLLHVFEGIIKDAIRTYPELKESFLKDYERIALYSEIRGLCVFTLDLPNLDSLLLRSFETGRLCLEGPLSHAVSKGTKVPRLFSGLWLRVFERDSSLKLDPDVNAILDLRTLCSFGKKLHVECSQDRINATLENYHDVERTLREPTLQWDRDSLGFGRVADISLTDCVSLPSACRLPDSGFMHDSAGPGDEHDGLRDRFLLQQCQHVADIIVESLGYFDPLSYSAQLERDDRGIGFKHGPGAVADMMKQHEKSSFPLWPHKLESLFPFQDCGKTAGNDRDLPLNHELASRLICVPKSAKAPRLIAAEPVQHQWCQQITWRWLESRLLDTYNGDFIDFRRQSASADMVIQASLDRKCATVDLSDASDRLSCWTVERVFRTNKSVLRALHAARTRYLKDEISSKGSSLFIKLNKFASQGTATTFPVQSIVFLVIAIASAIGDGKVTKESILRCRHQVRVYGDDIIIPSHGYVRLVRIMELLQLKVNMAKSYVHGRFRESCGTDGFAGYDVTPVKPKVIVADGPTSCQAVIDTSNNLFCKGYWNASQHLISTLPPHIQRGLRIVGRNEVGLHGLTSFCGSDESHLKKRWNSRLHRFEGRVWRLSPDSQQRDRGGFDSLLDFFAQPHNPWNPRIVSSYGRIRKIRSDLLWEPLNMGAHGNSCSSFGVRLVPSSALQKGAPDDTWCLALYYGSNKHVLLRPSYGGSRWVPVMQRGRQVSNRS